MNIFKKYEEMSKIYSNIHSVIDTFFVNNGFSVGKIVWTKYNYDGMYWPGRITSKPNNLQYQSWSYFVQFSGCHQTNRTMDDLSYK
ncbi:unnamed protein product [Adineta steineri]|uniref:Uncharacterized protein n=1 Tax=Adineta steineri TaxID=433720 RepID=A0A815JI03_9BILA|nr:unnamed protein product [Adineta steineri]CAF1224819.1 unnamed protein product [Adineta steineri]CAF1301015.1 unnamed protein product [Adineta steineri]CAF1301838.1 unnamed protein product [Adineta steineri]CAF1378174.1 unnamed protein product [Adineta steineri]